MKLSNASMKSPARLCVGGLLLSLAMTGVLPVAAQAQDKPQVATSGIEDIVVIARRRQENVQSVPIAITALSPQKMERLNITRDSDVYKTTPGVGGHSNFPNLTYVAIRGQDGKGAVVPYQNEVPQPSQGINDPYGVGIGGPAMFYDMESVQVLKGPQGTLFGRNTTGGAILYQTAKPKNEFGGSITLGYGNYNNKEATAVLNAPLVDDKVLLRVAGTYVNRDGYTKVLSTPKHPNGYDTQNKNAYSLRGTLTLKPNDNVQNDMIVQYMESDDHGTSSILKAINHSFAGGFIDFLFPNLQAQLNQQNALGPRTSVPLSTDPAFHDQYWNVTDIFKYDVSDNLTIRNIASYQKFKILNFATDGDGTASTICDCLGYYVNPQLVTQYTEEFQVQGKSFENKLNWTVGAFFLHSPPQSDFNIQWNKFFSFDGTVTYNEYRSGDTSKAVYAQGTYDLSSVLEGLKFTAGLRYTWDHTFDSVRKNVNVIAGPCPEPEGRPNADSTCTQTGQGSFHAPTWTIGFDYQINPNTLTYVVSRRGYRQGGLNPGSSTSAFALFQPEHVTDLEVGVKSDWSVGDAKVRTNAALFRQWYNNIQTEDLRQSGTNLTFVFYNGPKAIIQGGEFETIVEPVQNLELTGSVAYLDQSYDYTGVTLSTVITLQNEILQNKPKWKYNLGATYHLPVDARMGDVAVSVNWNYQSTQGLVKSAPDHPWDRQPSYGLLDLNINWDDIYGSPVSGVFYMTNVLDKLYAVGSYALGPAIGISSVTYGEPRMFGFRLKYKFGSEAG
jgi:iron complex outermembrane receptor protein